jgi:ABC-type cobalamin transport system ATPase subunit
VSNWQHLAQQQAALQQQALLQLLAPQLAAQSPALQHPAGISGLNGTANGAGQPVGVWQQPQPNPEQINPAVLQQLQHQLQRLAQYHYLVAQQFAQLAAQQMAAQQAAQNPGNPYAGQFVPGITMH